MHYVKHGYTMRLYALRIQFWNPYSWDQDWCSFHSHGSGFCRPGNLNSSPFLWKFTNECYCPLLDLIRILNHNTLNAPILFYLRRKKYKNDEYEETRECNECSMALQHVSLILKYLWGWLFLRKNQLLESQNWCSSHEEQPE